MEKWRVALEAQLVTPVNLVELSSVVNRASCIPGKVVGENFEWEIQGIESQPSIAILTKIEFVPKWPYLSDFMLNAVSSMLQLFDSANDAPHGNIKAILVGNPSTVEINQDIVLCLEPTSKKDVLYIEGAQTKRFIISMEQPKKEKHSIKTLHLRFGGLTGGDYPDSMSFDRANAVTWAARMISQISHARIASFAFSGKDIINAFDVDLAVENLEDAVDAVHHANTDQVMEYFRLETTNFETTEGQSAEAYSEEFTKKLVTIWSALPFGIIRMREDHIMTSANIASVTDSNIILEIRSSRESAISNELRHVLDVLLLAGIEYKVTEETIVKSWVGKSRGFLKQLLGLPKTGIAHKVHLPSDLTGNREYGVIDVDEQTGNRLIELVHGLGKYQKKPSLLDL